MKRIRRWGGALEFQLKADFYACKTYDIATKVGVRDEKYFYKVFKKCKGMTLREYRMRENKEKL